MKHGQPKTDNEQVRKAAELITKLYALPNCGVGGHLHIVTDDFNIRDSDLQYCKRILVRNTHEHDEVTLAVECELCDLLLSMSVEERASAIAMADGYFDSPVQHTRFRSTILRKLGKLSGW